MKRFRFRIHHLFLLCTVVAISTAAFLVVQEAMSTRTLVAVDLPQNQRFRVIQTFGGEPFDTKIYFDSGDGQWGFYYYEHEDWYWNEATLESHDDTLIVFRNGQPVIQLDTQTGVCVVQRPDGWHREYNAPLYFTTSLPDSPEADTSAKESMAAS